MSEPQDQDRLESTSEAEEVLRRASAYVRSLIEASLDLLVTIGPDGKITDVNAATEAVTGYARGQLIGTDFSEYFTEPGKARAGYEQVFREGAVRDYPLEIRHRDGRLTSVLYHAAVYRDDHGRVIGVFAAARDITERKRGGGPHPPGGHRRKKGNFPVLPSRSLLTPAIRDTKRPQGNPPRVGEGGHARRVHSPT